MPGIIEGSGATPDQRKKLFYGVCVPLRLILAFLVHRKYSSPIVQGIVLAFSTMSIYTNLLGLNSSNDIWWSQKFHLFVSIKIVACLLIGRPEYVSLMMVSDVLYGVLVSFAKDPWTSVGI